MTVIDFNNLKDIHTQLTDGEIQNLNQVFNAPEIQTTLAEIEKQRKIREKWKWISIGICIIVGIVWVYFIGEIQLPIFIGFLVLSGVNSVFSKKIEIPLKEKVLARICPILYSKLEYSYGGKYSFDDISNLVSLGFLRSYDSISLLEDSIYFPMEKDGKTFFVHGFEFKTTRTTGTGKNRHTEVTNNDYLIKAEFPYARIPMQDTLRIEGDSHESGTMNASLSTFVIMGIMILFGIVFASYTFMSLNDGFSVQSVLLALVPIILIIVIPVWIWKNFKNKEKTRVTLENIDFEKFFDVYCTDQVASRMIVTPAFMDRLVRLVQKTGNKYEFLFQSNVMYVKRKIIGSYLEAGTSKNMINNLEGYVKFYTDMREIMEFVYDMNLMYLSKTDVNFVSAPPLISPLGTTHTPFAMSTPVNSEFTMTLSQNGRTNGFIANAAMRIGLGALQVLLKR